MRDRNDTWDWRIRRAEQLAGGEGATAPLLAFYGDLLRQQKSIYESLDNRKPAGSVEHDIQLIVESGSPLLRAVADRAPQQLADEARALLERGRPTQTQLLLDYWKSRSDRQFFSKTLLQPYCQWLVDRGVASMSADVPPVENRCPRCGGAPQASILDSAGVTGDGSTRRLLCATCLTPWPFRRVVCPSCGEEDERKIGYFQSTALDHVRVDACDTCRRYVKTIDLGRLGLAVPLVDEVAGAPLDIWARERGYEKIELNLVGL